MTFWLPLILLLVGNYAMQLVESSSCPLYWKMKSIREEGQYANNLMFNYTKDMMNSWESYSCDSMPNALLRGDTVINGAALVDYQYNMVMIDSGYKMTFCNSAKSNETLELFEMFNNSTLMEKHFVPYLDSLLVEKNFTIPRSYFIEGFDTILQHGQKQTKLFELVNAFNYFIFCKESNPFFEQFHTQTLPSIVQKSSYTRVQTLDVLFGENIVQTCSSTTIPFFNRTLLCFCPTMQYNNGTDVDFGTLSFFECSSVYVKFWVPLSSHASLKIIEILFHILQLIVIFTICFIPILTRSVKKWKDHLSTRQNIAIMNEKHNVKKNPQISPLNSINAIPTLKELASTSSTPQSFNNLALNLNDENNSSSENCSSTPNTAVSIQVVSPEHVETEIPKVDISQNNVNETKATNRVRNSMKEHLQHELLRIICDMKLLTIVSLLMGVFCLFMNALLHVSSSGVNGTAAYPTTTFLIASLAFICVYNIPLAGSFVEVLLKLDGKNKRVSILGL